MAVDLEAADGVELAEDGVDVPAQWRKIVALVQDDALLVEDERAAVAGQVGGGGEAAVFVVVVLAVEGAEAVGDRAVGVRDQGVGYALGAAIGPGGGKEPFVDVRSVGAAADEDGVATFSDVPVGDYTLEVESSRFSPVQRPGVAVVERQVTDLGIVEVAPAGQLRGVVEDQDGQRVMALVQCRPVGEEEWSRSEVAVQGAYRIRGMKPGRYEVRARSLGLQEGAPSAPVEVEVVAGKTKVADLRVTK